MRLPNIKQYFFNKKQKKKIWLPRHTLIKSSRFFVVIEPIGVEHSEKYFYFIFKVV